MGIGKHTNIVHIIDFGLLKEFRNPLMYQHILLSEKLNLLGQLHLRLPMAIWVLNSKDRMTWSHSPTYSFTSFVVPCPGKDWGLKNATLCLRASSEPLFLSYAMGCQRSSVFSLSTPDHFLSPTHLIMITSMASSMHFCHRGDCRVT